MGQFACFMHYWHFRRFALYGVKTCARFPTPLLYLLSLSPSPFLFLAAPSHGNGYELGKVFFPLVFRG